MPEPEEAREAARPGAQGQRAQEAEPCPRVQEAEPRALRGQAARVCEGNPQEGAALLQEGGGAGSSPRHQSPLARWGSLATRGAGPSEEEAAPPSEGTAPCAFPSSSGWGNADEYQGRWRGRALFYYHEYVPQAVLEMLMLFGFLFLKRWKRRQESRAWWGYRFSHGAEHVEVRRVLGGGRK